MEEEEEEEFLCLCEYPQICTCIFEMDWMKELLDPIYDEGYQNGFEDGTRSAIHHTIYGVGDEGGHEDFSFSPLAYLDPCRYRRAYSDGYDSAYTATYKRHAKLLAQLQSFHKLYWYKRWVNECFQGHLLFEPAVLNKIEIFFW